METVSFYSYKGGVGRSLLVANTAQFLAMSGKRVVALDLDLEAPGLHYKLGTLELQKRAASGELKGAADVLVGLLDVQPRHFSLDQIVIETPLPREATGSLLLFPAGSAPSQPYWSTLERLNTLLRSGRRDIGLLEAVLEVQAQIEIDIHPDFLLIDSRTGITELGGLATCVMADRVVCLTTTAPESLDGTRVVAEALRVAPRMPSQRPIIVEFLVTRVTPNSLPESTQNRLADALGTAYHLIPHDPPITNSERIYGMSWSASSTHEGSSVAGTEELLPATFKWISKSFIGLTHEAERALKRMTAVREAWRELTDTEEVAGGFDRRREAWPEEFLNERVPIYGAVDDARVADIVVYDSPATGDGAKPYMIIEYIDDEDPDEIAGWWMETQFVPVYIAISDRFERHIYTDSLTHGHRARRSQRQDLPLPLDFYALRDPSDPSVPSLLDAIKSGHTEYVDRVVIEWARANVAGPRFEGPPRQTNSIHIVDELASIGDASVATGVLCAISDFGLSRNMLRFAHFDEMRDLILDELYTTLLWRCPYYATVNAMFYHAEFGRNAGQVNLSLLARRGLGLEYEPDSTFRRQWRNLLGDSPSLQFTTPDSYRGLIRDALSTQLSFEMSDRLSPLAEASRGEIGDGLLSHLVSTHTLVTTGLLAQYDPESGYVVVYGPAVDECASLLHLRPRHVGSVALIHETIHALSHVSCDLDGRRWDNFDLPSASEPQYEPSWFHEAVAQYFTYRHLVALRDKDLLAAFETMSTYQVPQYRTWERMKDLPVEDVRGWLMNVRRGVENASRSVDVLFRNSLEQ